MQACFFSGLKYLHISGLSCIMMPAGATCWSVIRQCLFARLYQEPLFRVYVNRCSCVLGLH